eukprot:s3842_g2.t1
MRRAAAAVRVEALHLFLLGASTALPTTQLPKLQAEVFHEPYVVAGALVSVKGLLNTVIAPYVGAYVDQRGRHRLCLMFWLGVLAVPFLAILAAADASTEVQLWAFLALDAALGLAGPASALCFSRAGRCLSGPRLTEGYSVLNFALSSGVGVGAALGVLGNFTTVGKCGLAVTSVNTLLALLSPQDTSVNREESSVPRQVMSLWSNSVLKLLAAVVFLDFLAEQMLVSLLLLYLEAQFHLSSVQLACQLGLVGLAASVSLLLVVPYLQPRLGDLLLMQVGMVANVVSVALFGVITAPWQAFLPPVGCILSFAVFPTANAIAAASVPRCGAMAQGVVSGARTLAEGLAPVIFGALFQAAAKSSFPGWPFLVAAGFVAVGLVVSFYLPKQAGNEQGGGTALHDRVLLDQACHLPQRPMGRLLPSWLPSGLLPRSSRGRQPWTRPRGTRRRRAERGERARAGRVV